MAISHELSSEIATALLAAKDRSPRELEDLKEIVLLVHSTLQRLTNEGRANRLKPLAETKNVAAGKQGSADLLGKENEELVPMGSESYQCPEFEV